MRSLVALAVVACKASDRPPQPAPAAPPPPPADAAPEPPEITKTRALLQKATPAEKPFLEKLLAFYEEDRRHDPHDHAGHNRRFVALVTELVPMLNADTYRGVIGLADTAHQTWSATRYHGDFALDAPFSQLLDDLATALPNDAAPRYMIARFMADSQLDEEKGLAAAKRCLELPFKLGSTTRAEVDAECHRLHDKLATTYQQPRCSELRGTLVLYRGGPEKSTIDPTVQVTVDGLTFYRSPKPLLTGHVTGAAKPEGALLLKLDPQGALTADDLRGRQLRVDDWVIVERDGTPLFAGNAELDFGRLVLVPAKGHDAKLEMFCTKIEQRTLPAKLR